MVFTSKQEKRLWLYTCIAIIGIIGSVFLGRPLIVHFSGQFVSNTFWVALWAVIATVIIHGLITNKHKLEIALWIGIFAIYLLVFLRMAITAERSHLIEYGVLAIFIYEALKERHKISQLKIHPAFMAFGLTAIIGSLDECLQIVVPNRFFDWIDIGFNIFAAFLAIASSSALSWLRVRIAQNLN